MSIKPNAENEKQFAIAIGRVIHEQRKIVGISQYTLGYFLGVSFQQVQKYEKGVNPPSIYKLSLMADVFRTPLEQLLAHAQSKLRILPNAAPADDSADDCLLAARYLRLMDKRERAALISFTRMLTQGRDAA